MGHVTATLEFWEWSNLMTIQKTGLFHRLPSRKLTTIHQKRGPFEKENASSKHLVLRAMLVFGGIRQLDLQVVNLKWILNDFEFNLYAIWDTT